MDRTYALTDRPWGRIQDLLTGRAGRVGAPAKNNRPFVDAVPYCGSGAEGGAARAIGRSRAGLSAETHAAVDALGDPAAAMPTPGQASDPEGADVLLEDIDAQAVIADKAS